MIPTTFKDYLRLLYSRFLVAAGIAIGIGVVAIIAILVWGGWPSTLYGQIITILGTLAIGGGAALVLVIAFLGLGGPAHSIKAAFKGASIETEGDADCE